MEVALVLRTAAAADLMTPGPVSLAASATVGDAINLLTSRGYSAAMVLDDAGRPAGVVTKTDLLVHARERGRALEPEFTPVKDVMTPAVFAVREGTPAPSVVEQFLALNVHHLFVADAGGTVVGIISPMDVLRKLA